MIMAVELTVSKIGKGQTSDRLGHNEIDYNSLECDLGQYILKGWIQDFTVKGRDSAETPKSSRPRRRRGIEAP